jgi:hypothetical protein
MPRKPALQCPVEILKRYGVTDPNHAKQMEKMLAAVQQEFQELKVANSQLKAREHLLADTCRTLSLVAAVLLKLDQHGTVGHDAVMSLQAEISDLSAGCHELADITSLQQDPGGAEQFLQDSLNMQRVLCPSSCSVLHGRPLSLLQCSLIAFAKDPLLRQEVASSMQQEHEVRCHFYENAIKEAAGLGQLLEQAEDGKARSEAVGVLASWVLFTLAVQAGLQVIAPSPNLFHGLITDDASHPLGQPSNPARMEEITNKLGFSRGQVQDIMQGLQVFTELQRPLDKQVAALLSRIHQLLQLPSAPLKPAGSKQLIAETVPLMPRLECGKDRAGRPVTAVLAPGTAAAGPEAASTASCATSFWDKPGPAKPPGGSAATAKPPGGSAATAKPPGGSAATAKPPGGSAATAKPPGGSAATAKPPGGSAATAKPPGGSAATAKPPGGSAATAKPYEDFLLSSVQAANHEELQLLLKQLHRAQQKLLWLDTFAGWFVVGCFTWEQHIKALVEAWPHTGSGVLFAKSLALRSSLRWLNVLEGEYGS